MVKFICLFSFIFIIYAQTSLAEIIRKDFFIKGENNINLFVRQVKDSDAKERKLSVLLIHGARFPGVASFDLQVENGSLAADLANAGHTVYLMDARGYGKSTRPTEMNEPRDANSPLVRSLEVVRDIKAAADEIKKLDKVSQMAALGWATGGHWAGYFASLHPESVSHLIIYNSLYGAYSKHDLLGFGSNLEDEKKKENLTLKDFKHIVLILLIR